jgi:hypothetical protein
VLIDDTHFPCFPRWATAALGRACGHALRSQPKRATPCASVYGFRVLCLAKSEIAGRQAHVGRPIFNDASHGHHPGDIECWLSGDGGITWKFGSAATQHEPDTIRMNHAVGLAANGDLIVLTSGWSNRYPPNAPRTRGSFRYEVLGPWLSRSRWRTFLVGRKGRFSPNNAEWPACSTIRRPANCRQWRSLCVSLLDARPLGEI